MKTYICENCKKEFKSVEKTAKYCSRKCWNERNQEIKKDKTRWYSEALLYGSKAITQDGYNVICYKNLNKREHIIIWELNNGEIPIGCEIHHKNGIKRDNRIDNLSIITKQEHAKISNKENPDKLLKFHISREDVTKEIIEDMISKGYTKVRIAKELLCSRDLIHKRLKAGNVKDNRRKDITLSKILELKNQGFGTRKIAKELNCNRDLIMYRIGNGSAKYHKNHDSDLLA